MKESRNYSRKRWCVGWNIRDGSYFTECCEAQMPAVARDGLFPIRDTVFSILRKYVLVDIYENKEYFRY